MVERHTDSAAPARDGAAEAEPRTRLRGTNQEAGRPHNRRIVLELLRRHGPMSRADISRSVGLSIQTVSNITRELEEAGFLVARRGASNRRGHPPSILGIREEGGLAFGVQITPTGLRAALVDLAGRVIGEKHAALPRRRPEAALARIARMIDGLRALRPDGRHLGVGVAMPGPFDVDSMSFVGPTTLEGWKGVPLGQRIEAATGLPTFVEDDAACAAMSESLHGGRSDFYYLYFGIGLGGSAMIDGQLMRGAFGNAGEIGHLPIGAPEERCPCGNSGCLERVVSLDGLFRRLGGGTAPTDGRQLERAIAANPAEVQGWIDDAAPLLAKAVVIVENLFDPATVVIGGLLPERLARRLIEAASPLPPSVSEVTRRTLDRLTCSTIGPDAALSGAGLLAVTNVLSPRGNLGYPGGIAGDGLRDPIVADVPTAALQLRRLS